MQLVISAEAVNGNRLKGPRRPETLRPLRPHVTLIKPTEPSALVVKSRRCRRENPGQTTHSSEQWPLNQKKTSAAAASAGWKIDRTSILDNPPENGYAQHQQASAAVEMTTF